MAGLKYYAVKKGLVPGIYMSWDECKYHVIGFKGAIYKSFPSLQEAAAYLAEEDAKSELSCTRFKGGVMKEGVYIPKLANPLKDGECLVYVDGSYDNRKKRVGYGYVIYYKDTFVYGYGGSADKHLVQIRNVGGEVMALLKAIDEIDFLGEFSYIEVRHDYIGLSAWARGSWSPTKEFTTLYSHILKDFISRNEKVYFEHIKGHRGEPGNEAVDRLAKKGVYGAGGD